MSSRGISQIMKVSKLKSLVLAALLAMATAFPANAASIDKPEGKVVLTITGNIQNTNDGQAATFDLAMLEKIAGRQASMETPWTEGETTFEGPILRNILKQVGASGKTMRIVALNDYAADVPIEDAEQIDTILATKMNGKPMSVRDKGPLFLIYPFDLDSSLYNEKYFARSVWQIKQIEIVN